MPGRAMLHLINHTLGKFGRDVSCRILPHLSVECQTLSDRRIVMVDDTPIVLQAFIPSLTLATLGQARFILHESQALDELCAQTLSLKPYAVLLDGQLAGNAKGTDLAKRLRQNGYSGFLVGFSTCIETFHDAESQRLVDASLLKVCHKPESVVEAVAFCLRTLELRRRTN